MSSYESAPQKNAVSNTFEGFFMFARDIFLVICMKVDIDRPAWGGG